MILPATMKFPTAYLLPLALSAQAIRIIQSNDDGWAELYTRSLHDALTQSNHSVVLAAPASNKAGKGQFLAC